MKEFQFKIQGKVHFFCIVHWTAIRFFSYRCYSFLCCYTFLRRKHQTSFRHIFNGRATDWVVSINWKKCSVFDRFWTFDLGFQNKNLLTVVVVLSIVVKLKVVEFVWNIQNRLWIQFLPVEFFFYSENPYHSRCFQTLCC